MGAVLICLTVGAMSWVAKKFGDLAFDTFKPEFQKALRKLVEFWFSR
jgi:hypothetical protein